MQSFLEGRLRHARPYRARRGSDEPRRHARRRSPARTSRHRFARARWLVPFAAAAVAAAGCAEPAAEHDASIQVLAPRDGDSVPAGNPVELEVQLSRAGVEQPGAEQKGLVGHLHVFVDGQIVGMPNELEPQVTLEPGPHTITVEFVDGAHRTLNPKVVDEVRVTAKP